MALSSLFSLITHITKQLFTLPARIPAFALLSILAALSFAGRAIVTKSGGPALPFGPLLLFQGLMSLPMSILLAKGRGVRLAPPTGTGRLYAIRVILGLATFALQVYSLQLMPASLASTLTYTAPLFTALLAPVILGESTSLLTFVLTFVGFVGVSLNAAPHWETISPGALAIGVGAGVTSAGLQLAIRQLGTRGEPGFRGVFLTHIATTVTGGVLCLTTSWTRPSGSLLVVCFGIALMNTIGQIATATAYSRGKALPVNALSFLTLPFTLILAVVLLAEHITLLAICGVVITLPACLGLVFVEYSRTRLAHKDRVSIAPDNLDADMSNAVVDGANVSPRHGTSSPRSRSNEVCASS